MKGLVGDMVGWAVVNERVRLLVGGYVDYLVSVRVGRCGGRWVCQGVGALVGGWVGGWAIGWVGVWVGGHDGRVGWRTDDLGGRF